MHASNIVWDAKQHCWILRVLFSDRPPGLPDHNLQWCHGFPRVLFVRQARKRWIRNDLHQLCERTSWWVNALVRFSCHFTSSPFKSLHSWIVFPTNIDTTRATPTATPLVIISDAGRGHNLGCSKAFSPTILTPALASGQPTTKLMLAILVGWLWHSCDPSPLISLHLLFLRGVSMHSLIKAKDVHLSSPRNEKKSVARIHN